MQSFIFSKSSIQESITTMCKVWAQKGIYVGFDKRPCTDGNHIYLGSLNGATQDDMKIALSHAAHEVNHILHTNFAHLSRGRSVMTLITVIEDIRVDSLGFSITPGTFLFRQDGVRILINRDQAIKPEEDDSPERCLCVALYWALAKKKLGYRLPQGFVEKAIDAFKGRYGEKLFNKILALGLKGSESSETKEVVSFARKISNLFAKHLAKEESKNQQSQSPMDTSDGNNLGGEDDSSDPQAAVTSSSNGRGKGISKKFVNFENVANADMTEVTERVLQGLHDCEEDEEKQIPVWPAVATPFPNNGSSKFLQDAQLVWSRYVNEIRKCLQAPVFARDGIGSFGTTLDTSIVSRVMTGDSRIFIHRADVRRESAAVAVLLDRSGSMEGHTLYMAKMCSYAICSLFEMIKGCSTACYAFPGIVRNTMLEIKGFGQKCRSSSGRFANVKAFGFTPLCETMFSAAAQLNMQNQQKRKLIVVITDGLNCEPQRIRSATEILTKQGFELFCLSIGFPDDEPLFERQKTITHYSQMPQALKNLLFEYMKQTRLV
ncbi:MAG: hypothetical protein LUC43_06160 [Burkholderiales bacterium]|nr:hypothetical protein [Burkholderiales bacterium]